MRRQSLVAFAFLLLPAAAQALPSTGAGAAFLILELAKLDPLENPSGDHVIRFEGASYRVVSSTQAAEGHRALGDAEGGGPPCEESAGEQLPPGTPEFYATLGIVVFLISCAAVMAGCQMGFMSIDATTLRLKEEEGTAEEKRCASAVSAALTNRHHLLVALLICNAAANEALPIFLDKLVPSEVAILVSVTCVLIFGEILPSALMLGPRQLMLAAALAPAVRGLMIITSPLSVPIARLLDVALGHSEASGFKRNEFKALVRMQARAKGWAQRSHNPPAAASGGGSAPVGPSSQARPAPLARTRTPAELRRALSSKLGTRRSQAAPAQDASPAVAAPPEAIRRSMRLGGLLSRSNSSSSGGSASAAPLTLAAPPDEAVENATAEFSDDEVTILSSVFSLQSKTVVHLLEPRRNTWDHVKMVRHDGRMDLTTMQLIQQWGNSRVPTFAGGNRNNVRGMLLVKEHLALDPDDALPIASLKLRYPVLMHPDTTAFDALNIFQTGASHMALLTPHGAEIVAAWQSGEAVPEHVRILGVCTIEDVIEELIGEEILDDTDQPLTPKEHMVAQWTNWNSRGIWFYRPPPSPRATPTQPSTEAEHAAAFSAADPLLP